MIYTRNTSVLYFTIHSDTYLPSSDKDPLPALACRFVHWGWSWVLKLRDRFLQWLYHWLKVTEGSVFWLTIQDLIALFFANNTMSCLSLPDSQCEITRCWSSLFVPFKVHIGTGSSKGPLALGSVSALRRPWPKAALEALDTLERSVYWEGMLKA